MADQYQQRPGSGALFANDPAKKTNPNQPDFNGNAVIDPAHMAQLVEAWKNGEPVKLEISGWKKQSSRGTSFVSLAVKPPRAGFTPGQAARPAPKPQPDPWGGDDPPF